MSFPGKALSAPLVFPPQINVLVWKDACSMYKNDFLQLAGTQSCLCYHLIGYPATLSDRFLLWQWMHEMNSACRNNRHFGHNTIPFILRSFKYFRKQITYIHIMNNRGDILEKDNTISFQTLYLRFYLQFLCNCLFFLISKTYFALSP